MSTRGTVTIKSEDDRRQIATWARNVDLGTVVTFRKKSRSTEQNSKLHAMLGEVSKQVEWHGQYLDPEDWKDMFTASLRHARVVPGIDKGTYVPLGMHTSTLTIEEMSNLIELIYAFGAEHGVIFKDPKTAESDVPASETPEAAPASGTEQEVSRPGASCSTLSGDDLKWLATIARMLWAATKTDVDTDNNLRLLNAQRVACNAMPDANPSDRAKAIASTIYVDCKNAVMSLHTREYTLAKIANLAGCTEKQITIGG